MLPVVGIGLMHLRRAMSQFGSWFGGREELTFDCGIVVVAGNGAEQRCVAGNLDIRSWSSCGWR
eukprot:5572466-Pyramimonas_sp.AAC.1